MHTRRSLLYALTGALMPVWMVWPAESVIEGVLRQPEGKPPTLDAGRQVPLDGDADTMAVLKDKRLAGSTLELKGQSDPSGKFKINPFHTHAVHVLKDGKRLFITYWCDVCSIRTYTPGKCWCCQDDTALDLTESIPGEKD